MKPLNGIAKLLSNTELEQANKELRKKLMENGSLIVSNELEPEIENEFLSYILEFEEQYEEMKRVRVYDYIGRPEFIPADRLNSEEVKKELKRIMRIMLDNNVELNMLCNYDDSVIYRFITEELFDTEMNDIRITGMRTCYIYEEFHRNHEYDIRSEAEKFLECFYSQSLNVETLARTLCKEVHFESHSLPRNELLQKIMMLHESCGEMKLLNTVIEYSGADFSNGKASVAGNISFLRSGEIATGMFEFGFALEHGYWCISSIWDGLGQ